ncbi:MAG: siphovirus Gp157 family protein [Lachnospiraceae bacterium]|nr:siphovirus Gp157 family protein [Lachnospiraceae bacterium]
MRTRMIEVQKATRKADALMDGMVKIKAITSIQKNGGLAPLEIDGDISDIPNDYLIEHDPTPDNAKIRELLKTEKVPWAHLGERGESLRIK